MQASLPDPDPATLERSARLSALIRARITAAGGALPFDDFMALALYAPELGYYADGRAIFGAAGDFLTAPESGSLFAQCVARQCAEVLAETGGDVVEYGAGSGRFAEVVLESLAALGALPRRYVIVEPSAGLAARQRARLAAPAAALGVTLQWHAEHPPAGQHGVVFANEMLDAMPVKRFALRAGTPHELLVGIEDGRLCWVEAAQPMAAGLMPPELRAACAALPDGYVSEFNPALAHWLRGLAASFERGIALFCDYGYPAHEYLHPARSGGTLKCHYRHLVHGDALWHPGAQDITASVDFTALAEAATAAGFMLAGYASQTRFLLACGLHELLAGSTGDAVTQYALAQEAKRLLLPGEMGQTFKVMALARDCALPLRGFRDDERHRLSDFDSAQA